MNNIIKRTWNKNAMVNIEDLRGMAFQAESGGHTFQISGIDGDGNPVALSGTPAGILLRSDNQDVTLTCSISDGKVNATLPANAYVVPGRFGLTIFLTSDGQKTAIYAAVGTVGKTSSGTVAPPAGADVVDLVNAIAAAVASIPASATNLMAAIAPTYSNTALYAVGQYAWYDGVLKRCIVPITTAESYTAAHWTNANLGGDVNDLKSALQHIEVIKNVSGLKTKTGHITSEVIQYWGAGTYGLIYFSCIPNTLYSITKTSGDYFRVAYIKDEPAVNVPVYNYVAISSSNTNMNYETGDDAKYIIIEVTDNSGNLPSILSNTSVSYLAGAVDSEARMEIASEENVKGYNLWKTGKTGVGAYYYSGGINYQPSYTSYRYIITPVKKNTLYKLSVPCRWYILTDDNDNMIANGESIGARYLNTGEATRLYYTVSAMYVSDDPILNQTIIAEGVHGTQKGLENKEYIKGLTQNMHEGLYACALPPFFVRFTVGVPETFYVKNILALDCNYVSLQVGSKATRVEKGFAIGVESAATANGYLYSVYDENLALIENNGNMEDSVIIKADNISNCSAIVIGDSTVAQNTMTQKIIDGFTTRNKTLTLLGTRGTSPNLHEGRSGWTTSKYLTGDSYEGQPNPFYNTTSGKFDFGYYMSNQGYGSVDFVVIQLGINDLYNTKYNNIDTAIETAINNICTMIDSILAFNSSQKILLNLPTPCNGDVTKAGLNYFLIRAKYVKYNQIIQLIVTKYNKSYVRCSNCHLILDADTDIEDNVHPNTQGYTKMANDIISQINVWQNGG